MTVDFGMFSEEGNTAVKGIVTLANTEKLSWSNTFALLSDLAKNDSYAEAMDTVVREQVYMAIGAGKRGEAFYC